MDSSRRDESIDVSLDNIESLRSQEALLRWNGLRILADIAHDCSNRLSVHLSVNEQTASTHCKYMQSERNWLMKNAVPHLRQYCRERGLDFQIADMRWGVREDASDDHRTTELCLKEIVNCQNISLGPNFVTFLGDKYGYRPLPANIEGSLFKLIKKTAMKLGHETSTILSWYKCDNNQEPSSYVLQPISSHFPYYIDFTAANAVLRQQAQRDWFAMFDKLSSLFRECVDLLYKERKISEEERHLFYQSVTENEVAEGILKVKDNSNKVICFERTLIDLDVTEKIASRYTDLNEEGVDKDVEELRERLRLVKVPAVLPTSQLFRYNVPWKAGGMDINENTDQRRYVKQFGKDFISSLEAMIEAAHTKSQAAKGRSPLLEEVLHHLYFCQSRIETFCGRAQLLKSIQTKLGTIYGENGDKIKSENKSELTEIEVDKKLVNGEPGQLEEHDDEISKDADEENKDFADVYEKERDNREKVNAEHMSIAEHMKKVGCVFTLGDSMDDMESDPNFNLKDRVLVLPDIVQYTKPIIVHGESGCGKTALMAKVAEQSKQWLPDSYCILRFLGTSTMSSTIREVLYHVCLQIWHLYKVPKPTGIDLDVDFQFLIKYFHALLWQIDTTDHPLVVILDSIDQLTPADHAHFFNWIPHKLPPSVHLLISMVNNRHDCLTNIRQLFVDGNQYVEVVKLEKETAEAMIGTLSRRRNRHLSKKQQNLLLQKFDSCSQPLYLKLLIDMAMLWKSYTKVNPTALGVTAKEAINHLFDNLEKNHGSVLIQKAFAYLCAAREGLTVTEIEDLLSLDDEVLQDTYIFHLPPDPNIIRLPPLLWKRVQNEIEEYLVERQSRDKKVVTWYHRQFSEAAHERYLPDDKKIHIHKSLAEYFQGVWSSKFKPLELKKGKKDYYPKAMRNVPAQPLKFSDTLYNTRKLSELPYHLINSGQYQSLLVDLLLDPDWLYGKCHVTSLTALMQDIQSAESSCAELVAKEKKRLSESKNSRKKDCNPVRKHQMDAEVLDCIKQLEKMILLASDSIRKDPVYLPLQILCQLGPDYHSGTLMDEFVSKCKTWCETNVTPLLTPIRHCMTPPGGHLMYTIEVNLAINEDQVQIFSGLSLLEDLRQLYAVQAQSAKPHQIVVLDIEDYGSCIQTVDFNCYVKSIRFYAKNKFLVLETDLGNSKQEVKLFRSNLATPVPLPKPAQAIAVSNSGLYIAYASGSQVEVLTTSEKEILPYYTIDEHNADVKALLISPKDGYLITMDSGKSTIYFSLGDKTMFVFDIKLKQLLHKIDVKLDLTQQCVITKQGMLISSMGRFTDGHFAVLYNLKQAEVVRKVKLGIYRPDFYLLHSSHLYVLIGFSGTGVTNGNTEKHASFIHIPTGQTVGKSPLNGPYTAMEVFGTDRLYFAVSQWRKFEVSILFAGTIQQPLSKARVVYTLSGHNNSVIKIIVTSTLDVMYTGSQDNTIKVWDIKPILEEFSSELSKLELTAEPDASLEEIVTGLTPKNTEKKHTTTVVALNRLGDCVYVGTDTSQLQVYDTENGQRKLTTDIDIGPVVHMMLSKNGQYLIVGGTKIHIEDFQSLATRVLKPRGRLSCMAESNNILVAGSAGMEAKGRVWNIATGEILKDFELLYSFHCVAINSLGNVVLSTMFEFPILVHLTGNEELGEGINMEKCDIMMTSAVSCCFSPDDKMAACSAVDGAVRIISSKGEYLYRLQQRSSAVALAFHPNGKTLVSAGYRSTYVWNMRDGSLKYKLTRHRDFVNSLKFDETGRYLITASRDKQLAVWDFRRCISIATFQTNCQVSSVDIAAKAEVVAYIPDGIADLAILRPNESLGTILRGHYKAPPVTPQTQALALAFTGQATSKTSRSCVVM